MTTSDSRQADAFKRIYPEQFYVRFVQDGIRPDGRPLGRSRAATFGLKAVSTSEGSGLIKLGNTTALAAVKLQVLRPSEQGSVEGHLIVNVELTNLCSPDARLGRPNPAIQSIQNRLNHIIGDADVIDRQQLQLLGGKAAWSIEVTVYVLDSDGCIFDAVLLAAVAALHDLTLPSITLSEEGKLTLGQDQTGDNIPAQKLTFKRVPLSLTTGIFKEHIIADPSSEEESLMSAFVSVVVDQNGACLGVYKLGGAVVSPRTIHTCIEACRLRYIEVQELLQQALTASMDTT